MTRDKKLAECVGLWLAEGDNKTKAEITFTNSCWELVELFHKTIVEIFNVADLKIRIYVYNSTGQFQKIPLSNVQIRNYIDKRARKPYFIWRLASVEVVKKWKEIVNSTQFDADSYPGILRGFFAGEGNIKCGSHNCRVIRMAQSKRVGSIEKSLELFGVDYTFSDRHREGYIISGKENFDKLAAIVIADLHPEKRARFQLMLSEYKQMHYTKFSLRNKIINNLRGNDFSTSESLASQFNRSNARISDILVELKKEGLVKNHRVRSIDYWGLADSKLVPVSHIKYKYLNMLLNDAQRTKDLASEAGVCWTAAFRRLKELERLGLVKRREDKMWELTPTNFEVISI
ncbi:hypothetical protein HYV82_01090 [Candidatus Woesearchaeota archaeon]|nr:hypothetical protein [Candidatus Woesearchaeota archaeon]